MRHAARKIVFICDHSKVQIMRKAKLEDKIGDNERFVGDLLRDKYVNLARLPMLGGILPVNALTSVASNWMSKRL